MHGCCDTGFELVVIFNSRFVNSPEEMAEYENYDTFAADKWSLIPVFLEKKYVFWEPPANCRVCGIPNLKSMTFLEFLF